MVRTVPGVELAYSRTAHLARTGRMSKSLFQSWRLASGHQPGLICTQRCVRVCARARARAARMALLAATVRERVLGLMHCPVDPTHTHARATVSRGCARRAINCSTVQRKSTLYTPEWV